MVGHASPPIPAKLVGKIWRGEFIDFNPLLSHRLGAPEPTLADALQNRAREAKQIISIEQWVVCFNVFTSVILLQYPQRGWDLLAYSFIIVMAAHDYEGTQWLSYDTHFRTLAATMETQDWSFVDQSLWSLHFNRAVVRQDSSNALSVGPYHAGESEGNKLPRKRGQTPFPSAKGKDRDGPYCPVPICVRWNKDYCVSPTCFYRHVCLSCHGQYWQSECSGNSSRGSREPTQRRYDTREAALLRGRAISVMASRPYIQYFRTHNHNSRHLA